MGRQSGWSGAIPSPNNKRPYQGHAPMIVGAVDEDIDENLEEDVVEEYS